MEEFMVKKISIILLSLLLTAVAGVAVGLGLTSGDDKGSEAGTGSESGTSQGTTSGSGSGSGGSGSGSGSLIGDDSSSGGAGSHTCEFTVLTTEEKADCVNGGYKLYACSHDGCSKTKKVDGVALGHDYKFSRTVEATCSEDEKNISVCSRCSDEKTETVTGAGRPPHSYGVYKSDNNATCGEDGTKTAYCSKCNTPKTVKDTGSATGEHVFGEYTPDNNGTCIKDGTQTAHCANCGATKSETLPDSKNSNNHNYNWTIISQNCHSGTRSGICSWCNGFTDESWLISDVWCDYKVTETKPATCTVDGYTKKVCTKCGDVVTETIEASGQHKPNENGTCTLCGELVGVCSGRIDVEFNYYNKPDDDFGTVYFEVIVVNPEHRKKDNGLWVMQYVMYVVQTYTVDGQTVTNRKAISLNTPDDIGSTFEVKLVELHSNREVTFSSVVDYSVGDGWVTVMVNGQSDENGKTYSFSGAREWEY